MWCMRNEFWFEEQPPQMSLWCDVCSFYILQVATPFVDLFAALCTFLSRLPLLSVSVYCRALAWHLTAWHCCLPFLSPSLSLFLSVSAGIFVFNYFLKSRLIENCDLLFEVFRLIKWSDKPVCKVFAVELAFLHSEREREKGERVMVERQRRAREKCALSANTGQPYRLLSVPRQREREVGVCFSQAR